MVDMMPNPTVEGSSAKGRAAPSLPRYASLERQSSLSAAGGVSWHQNFELAEFTGPQQNRNIQQRKGIP